MSMDWAGLIRRAVDFIGGKKPTGGCKQKRVCDVPEVRDTELRDTEVCLLYTSDAADERK